MQSIMKVKLLLGVFLIFMPFAIMAKSWRVNSNLSANADFSSLQDAHDDIKVYDGDTLYIEPGTRINSTVNISKALSIIGPGYSSTENNSIYGNNDVFIQYINIEPKKEMKYLISGLYCESINCGYGTIYNYEAVIERCKVSYISGTNIIVRNCVITDGIGSFTNLNTYFLGNILYVPEPKSLGMLRGHENAVFKNNTFIINFNGNGYIETISGSGSRYFKNSSFINNIIININPDSYVESQNTFYYKDKTLNFDVKNNNIYENNIFSTSTPQSKYPNNKWGYSIEDIFDLKETAEGYWKLKEGSPAKGYGINGEDCGAFGGEYPFVIGGAPKYLPIFYDVVIPSKAIDGKLPVKLKIKVQDE